MKDVAILYPVFVLVAVIFVLLGWMAKERLGAMRREEVKLDAVTGRPVFKGRAGQVSDAFQNAFEMPVLFFAVVAFSIDANAVDTLMVLLAWIYVAFRIGQAFVHTTYNKIPHRFLMFFGSCAALMIMWIKLALHVMSAGI